MLQRTEVDASRRGLSASSTSSRWQNTRRGFARSLACLTPRVAQHSSSVFIELMRLMTGTAPSRRHSSDLSLKTHRASALIAASITGARGRNAAPSSGLSLSKARREHLTMSASDWAPKTVSRSLWPSGGTSSPGTLSRPVNLPSSSRLDSKPPHLDLSHTVAR